MRPTATALLLVVSLLTASARPARACPGDCDGNGTVTLAEFAAMRAALLGAPLPCAAADADGNGRVTTRDLVMALAAVAASAQAGDCTLQVELTGRVLLVGGAPVAGATVRAMLPAGAPATAPRGALNADGKPLPAAAPAGRARLLSLPPGVPTAADGTFTLVVNGVAIPQSIAVTVEAQPAGGPVLTGARTVQVASVAMAVGDVVLPNPATSKLDLAGGGGSSASGDVVVSGVPGTVTDMYGASFDPDADVDAFPGDFTELGKFPLDSAGFQFVTALDASGNPVTQLDSAALVQGKFASSQLPTIQDAVPGTDRIEVPIYTYDETAQQWTYQGMGWIQDENGTILPEAALPSVQADTIGGKLYATYTTTHFSWFNVDYPYIGPWHLGRMPAALRNTDCTFRALRLATEILRGARGQFAFALVNSEGAPSLNDELPDGSGPWIQVFPGEVTEREAMLGRYTGDAALGGREDQIDVSDLPWAWCDEPGQRDHVVLLLAAIILHETAHWKDDRFKFPGSDEGLLGPGDTRGDEGDFVERLIFGGRLEPAPDGSGLLLDGALLSPADVALLLQPWNWPAPPAPPLAAPVLPSSPLSIAVHALSDGAAVGESFPVEVTYTNDSASPIAVVVDGRLEDLPLRFDLTHGPTGQPVGFLGPETKTLLLPAAATVIQPGASEMRVVDLVLDGQGQPVLYALRQPGTTCGRAKFAMGGGQPDIESNEFCFDLAPGGSIAGVVRRAEDGSSIAGATVEVFKGQVRTGGTVTDTGGAFFIEGLPPGPCRVEAAAPGFLRGQRTDLAITAGETTFNADVALSSLLAAGQMRCVLSWGQAPSDLDLHLWLPPDEPYHVYYGRRGQLDACPFAALDVDHTQGFGPETVTITQRIGNGQYVVMVRNYSGSPPLAGSGARVDVFDSTGLIAAFTAPLSGSGADWAVLEVDAQTGAITELGTIELSVEPYGDTAAACPEEDCFTSGDEDGDGLADCADPDCAFAWPCSEGANCHDDVDNDGDGFVDCDDPDCVEQCDESWQCHDDVDNDGDGLVDCADPDCASGCDESLNCDDGLDNDGDGLVDCLDPDCPCG